VSIAEGSSKILQFVPGRKIEEVEKSYNGNRQEDSLHSGRTK